MPETTPAPGQPSQSAAVPSRQHHSPPDLYDGQGDQPDAHVLGTRDAALIRAWATHHAAEPATGEETSSGPATVHVNDQGTGLRFNFPAAARFRPLPWEEWLARFDRDSLVFVFEISRDGESALTRFGGAYFRLVPASSWGERPLVALDT